MFVLQRLGSEGRRKLGSLYPLSQLPLHCLTFINFSLHLEDEGIIPPTMCKEQRVQRREREYKAGFASEMASVAVLQY